MNIELDYSEIKQEVQENLNEQEWEPPPHKFFSTKKDAKGKMEKEPIYHHQEYPRLMYALKDEKIIARLVKSDEEKHALGEGWEKSPSVFGYLGAPSFEENLKMKREAEIEVEAPRRGRPAKAA